MISSRTAQALVFALLVTASLAFATAAPNAATGPRQVGSTGEAVAPGIVVLPRVEVVGHRAKSR